MSSNRREFLGTALAGAAFLGSSWRPAAAQQETIKVRILHSLSGTMAISETTLKDEGYSLVTGKPERIYGAANAIVRTPSGWAAAADPRNGGAAMGD